MDMSVVRTTGYVNGKLDAQEDFKTASKKTTNAADHQQGDIAKMYVEKIDTSRQPRADATIMCILKENYIFLSEIAHITEPANKC